MVEVGSMEVVGVYKDGGLVSGFKEVLQNLISTRSKVKSVTVELQRFKAISVATGNVIASLGLRLLDMFKNTLASSPYLIGAFTRIRTDIMLMAWALTKYLKPGFDLLADAIHALRMGDWEGFKEAISGVVNFFIESFAKAWNWVKENGPEWLSDIMQSLEDTYNTIAEFDWEAEGLWGGIKNALKIIWDEVVLDLLPGIISDILNAFKDVGANILENIWNKILEWKAQKNAEWNSWWYSLGDSWGEQLGNGLVIAFKSIVSSFQSKENLGFFGLGDYLYQKSGGTFPTGATGRFVESDMIMKVHAGERIIPANSNSFNDGKGETNIILDFTGTVINLASGINLDDFADTVSRKIADNQAWGAY